MDRPTIVEMETECKLYIDRYCKLWLNDFMALYKIWEMLLLRAGTDK